MNTSVDRVDGYDVTVTETRNGEAKGTETGSGGKMGWGLLIGFSLGLLLGFLIDNVAAGIGFGTGFGLLAGVLTDAGTDRPRTLQPTGRI